METLIRMVSLSRISILAALVVLSGCSAGEKSAPRSATLESPKSGTSVTLESGTTLQVNSAPVGASIHIEEASTPSTSNVARQTTLSLSGTSDSASISLRLALNGDAPSTGVVGVIQDPTWPGAYFISDAVSAQSVVASSRVAEFPTSPLAVNSSTRFLTLTGLIGPNVTYAIYAFEAARLAVDPANNCQNVYLWQEEASGSGTDAPLVVLLHGWQPFHFCNGGGNPLAFKRMADFDAVANWASTIASLRADYPNSRIVVVRYATEFDPSVAAKYVLDQLDRDAKVTAATRVVLVGHSMGGLVARHIAHRWNEIAKAPKLAGIITLGTPHAGTPIASSGITGVLNSRWFLETEGSKALKPGTASTQAALPLDVPLHAVAGVVGCSISEEQRLNWPYNYLLSRLCEESGRIYWTYDPQHRRVAGTEYAGVSDAIVPTSSARADASSVASRFTLSGSVAHEELRSASTALTSVSALAKPYLAAVSSVSVTGAPSSMTIGATAQLTATLRASDNTVLTGRPVTWNSSNTSVATVSPTGLVTARAAGTTTITAMSEGRSGTATVQVVAGLGTGDVQITLTWDTTSDIDLWVTEPSGFTIWWQDPISPSGGRLDRDDQDGFGPENIYWPSGRAPNGSYRVRVNYYAGFETTHYTVVVKQFGYTRTYTGTLSYVNQTIDVVTFSAGSPLALQALTEQADSSMLAEFVKKKTPR